MLKSLANSRVAVVGLGKSGRSAIKFCRGMGAEVVLSEGGRLDDETAYWLKENGVIYEEGGHSFDFLRRADLVLISPGVPHYLPVLEAVRQEGVVVAGELALAALFLRTPMIAVTGTNGKTTVTTLIGDLLRAAGKKVFVGGNIGTPLTDYLAGSQDADWLVLEVSSFQLDAAGEFQPQIGVLLNISPDHLDRYKDLADYAQTKMRLFARQGTGDTAIINYDDAYLRRFCTDLGGQGQDVLYFGHHLKKLVGAEMQGRKIQLNACGEERFDLAGTYFACPPNLENAAAAILAVQAAGCSPSAIKQGMAEFKALPHRMTVVAEIAGVTYIDDSKATNIGAVAAALASVSGSVILIAGGRDKGGDYGLLAELVKEKVTTMLLIGEAGAKMAAAFANLTIIETMASLEEAVDRAAAISRSGDTVLLSPACASFDMFTGYAQRGEVFEGQVIKIADGERA